MKPKVFIPIIIGAILLITIGLGVLWFVYNDSNSKVEIKYETKQGEVKTARINQIDFNDYWGEIKNWLDQDICDEEASDKLEQTLIEKFGLPTDFERFEDVDLTGDLGSADESNGALTAAEYEELKNTNIYINLPEKDELEQQIDDFLETAFSKAFQCLGGLFGDDLNLGFDAEDSKLNLKFETNKVSCGLKSIKENDISSFESENGHWCVAEMSVTNPTKQPEEIAASQKVRLKTASGAEYDDSNLWIDDDCNDKTFVAESTKNCKLYFDVPVKVKNGQIIVK